MSDAVQRSILRAFSPLGSSGTRIPGPLAQAGMRPGLRPSRMSPGRLCSVIEHRRRPWRPRRRRRFRAGAILPPTTGLSLINFPFKHNKFHPSRHPHPCRKSAHAPVILRFHLDGQRLSPKAHAQMFPTGSLRFPNIRPPDLCAAMPWLRPSAPMDHTLGNLVSRDMQFSTRTRRGAGVEPVVTPNTSPQSRKGRKGTQSNIGIFDHQ